MLSRQFVEALTGSTSSVIANAIVYPLDVMTTRVQVKNAQKLNKLEMLKTMIKTKGILGIYAGMDVALIQTFWSSFLYFYIYSWIKKAYYKYAKNKTASIAMELLQGALAGAISRAITTPISVITTRLQASDKPTDDLKTVAESIYRAEGVFGFWRGFGATLILTSNPAITYGFYEKIKKSLPLPSTPTQSFFIGAFTKSLATIVTYPYILTKTRLQAGKDLGIIDCLSTIHKESGVLGYFNGVNEQLSKSVLSQAILFALRDYLTSLYKLIPVAKVEE